MKILLSTCCVCLFATSVVAQIDPTNTRDPRELLRREMVREEAKRRAEQQRRMEEFTFPFSALPKDAPLPFHLGYRPGLQQLFPFYEGLPTYPNNVPGYGGYPGAGKRPDELEPNPSAGGLEKPDVEKDRWPSWIEGGVGANGLRATAQQGVLVRVVDRVWFLAPEEEDFIPLVFHDRFRFMGVGAQVSVRGKGEFQMILHAGGSLRSRGPCGLVVAGMDPNEVSLQLQDVAQMWLQARLRPFRVELPDGTVVTFTDTLVHLVRRGDRCRVTNLGASPVQFSGSAGKGALEGPTYIETWMKPPRSKPVGDALEVRGDVARTNLGDATTLRGGPNGQVSWSGATFKLLGGSNLEIRPLAAAKSPR